MPKRAVQPDIGILATVSALMSSMRKASGKSINVSKEEFIAFRDEQRSNKVYMNSCKPFSRQCENTWACNYVTCDFGRFNNCHDVLPILGNLYSCLAM